MVDSDSRSLVTAAPGITCLFTSLITELLDYWPFLMTT